MTPQVDYFYTINVVIGWTVAGIVGAFGLIILVLIVTGKIDLSKILDDPTTNKASLSRLQFLIFTFVISLSLFLVIIGRKCKPVTTPAAPNTANVAAKTDCDCCEGPGFPAEIPAGIFALLGISGATYLVSKGVSGNTEVAKMKAETEKVQAEAEKAKAQAELAAATKPA